VNAAAASVRGIAADLERKLGEIRRRLAHA
jgi:hypothetical protein